MVTLIVPCYNSEQYIDRCLDSILSQTYNNIELIIVNDGSSDNTDLIIEKRRNEIEAFVSSFIYIKQENQGVGAACSAAYEKSTGKYISLLDSDDILLPDSIKLRAEFLDNNPDYALVRTNGYSVEEDDIESCDNLLATNEEAKQKEDIFEDIFNGSAYLWPGTYMIRSEILEKLYPDKKIYPSRSGQNMQFIWMASYKNRAGFIDVPLMKYVIRKESVSHFSSGNVLEKELKASAGYMDIRRYLISNYIDPSERNYWLRETDILHISAKVFLAEKHKNRALMKKCYEEYSDLGVEIDWYKKIRYYQVVNPPFAVILRIIFKLMRIFKIRY